MKSIEILFIAIETHIKNYIEKAQESIEKIIFIFYIVPFLKIKKEHLFKE